MQPYVGSELELFAQATNWKRYLTTWIKPYIGRRVLEVGAGIGGTTQHLCQGRSDCWICLEPDAKQLLVIENLIGCGGVPHCCTARQGTLKEIESHERFDTVLYIDVLEHIEDDKSETTAAAALLDSGGYLVILSPAYEWLMSPFDRAIGHYRRYTRKQLCSVMPSGLRLVKSMYLDSVGVFASVANRLFLQQSVPTLRQIAFWDNWMVPLSRAVDPLLMHSCGRSVLGIWQKPPA